MLQMKKLMKKMKMNCIEQLQEVIIHKTVVKVTQPCPKVVNNVKNLNGQKKIICTNQLGGLDGKVWLSKKEKQTNNWIKILQTQARNITFQTLWNNICS